MDTPMLFEDPWLVKCQHYGALVWADDQEQVGEIVLWDHPSEASNKFKAVPPFLDSSSEEYLGFLK